MILSASRRTDIPAFYGEWFIRRLEEGYALSRNPMNPLQVSKIFLSPEKIDCIVFWTKDPAPFMKHLPALDQLGYQYYFQFTLTPYHNTIEKNLRDKARIIETFQELSMKLGRHRVHWRYDPIIINDELTISYHEKEFAYLCDKLKYDTKTCTISYVDLYTKINKTVKENIIRDVSDEEMKKMASILAEIGHGNGVELRACSEKMNLEMYGIKPASCIDRATIELICGRSIKVKQDKNQREGCGCMESVDIGAYNTCKNGCIYCYANHSGESIERNTAKHNIESALLIGNLTEQDKISVRN
ncbi:MAG: hypothetical protein K0S47_2391 [Herbinix sp.]|jgi:hypothetical protein|nr:hypothetical protein [Herbinix sp.]